MKLISWNIDSLNAALTSDSARAKLSQDVLLTLVAENADIIAIQETKLSAKGPTKKHLEVLAELFPGYENTWRSSVEPARKGYAGTMFLYKKELTPTVTFPEIGAPSTMDVEGRIITLEFDNFFVTQVYTPNAGDGLKRLEERQIWDAKYADYLAELDQQKPVLATGDYNVAHKEIDLANPASNRRSPGFTDEEIRTHFQLLTREHNLLKDRACTVCKNENVRPAFLDIPFWYSGGGGYIYNFAGGGGGGFRGVRGTPETGD